MRGELSVKTIKSYLNQGQWSTVIAVCTEALQHNPSRLELYPLLGKAFAHQGKWDNAIAAYQQVIGSQLDQAEIHGELGLLYSKQHELVQAAWHYQQALALKPDWEQLQYNLAVVLHQLGDWQGAIAAYHRTIALKPDYAAVYFNLGVLYDQRAELTEAVQNYYQAIKLQPNYIKAYSNLGSIFAKQKKFNVAIEIYQQGLKLDPTWGTLHNNLGQVFWFNEQPELALASFETAVMVEPNMALAHHNLGKLWQQRGNYPAAIAHYQKVIELEPNNIWAYSHCADALMTQGNLPLAIDYLRKAIALQPTFVKTYCQRVQYQEPKDLLEQARFSCARFLEALQQKLDYEQVYEFLWQTYFYLGEILFEYGGIKQAELYYQQALQIKPQEVELYLRLGNCLAKQKKLDAAMTIYQMGLTLQANHPQICFQLGKILEKQEQAEQAINYYEAVLQQQLDENLERWQQLPNLFPSDDNLVQLPQQIYYDTQAWIRDCELDDFNYVQVPWEGTKLIKTSKEISQPEIVSVTEREQIEVNCGGVNCSACMSKLIEQFKPVQIGNHAYRCSELTTNIDTAQPFVVTIPEGRAWIAPQKNDWIICNALAVMTPDGYLLGDLSRHYPWFLPGCPYQKRRSHTVFSLEEMPTLEIIEGTVVLLSGLAGHVYYHWMIDILPRIEILRRSGIDLNRIDWFVVNNFDRPFQRETLNLLGIPAAKIIPSDRHSYLQAQELIVPSFPGYLDWVPLETIKFLRQIFLPQIDLAHHRYPDLVYISRAQARGRQVINEQEVTNLLQQLGFQTVFLEKMSVLEQVALFAHAKVIVSPHGSGLTNLVFCNPGATVVELFSPHYVRTDYWIISQQLQLKHYYSIGDSFDCSTLRHLMYQNSLTEDILVNLSSLNLILKVVGLID
jgi:tetratricopeptide (TPR) repeat protein/capsular polysaccharide biosynthesis protein